MHNGELKRKRNSNLYRHVNFVAKLSGFSVDISVPSYKNSAKNLQLMPQYIIYVYGKSTSK